MKVEHRIPGLVLGVCFPGIHNHGAKGRHYEESMRIPLMFRYPGALQPRQDDRL